MKHILILLLALSSALHGQTYVASASNPADNGTNATFVITATMPAGIAAGDLLVIVAQSRATGSTIAMEDFSQGGQTWQDSGIRIQETTITGRVFWCRYTGTMSGDVNVSFGDGTCTSVSTHAFRPANAANTWGLDQAYSVTSFGVPGGPPYNVTRTGQTTVNDNVVALDIYMTADDNSWFLVLGSAFSALATTQYRNTSGNDQSHSLLYQVLANDGTATGDATQRQTANGPDAGATAIILFREYAPTNRGFPVGGF